MQAPSHCLPWAPHQALVLRRVRRRFCANALQRDSANRRQENTRPTRAAITGYLHRSFLPWCYDAAPKSHSTQTQSHPPRSHQNADEHSLLHCCTQPCPALFMVILFGKENKQQQQQQTSSLHAFKTHKYNEPKTIWQTCLMAGGPPWTCSCGHADTSSYLVTCSQSIRWHAAQNTSFSSFIHYFTSCHPSPLRFLFLIFNTCAKLYRCHLFTHCDHQTKTRKRLKPLGQNLITCIPFYSHIIDGIWGTERALG